MPYLINPSGRLVCIDDPDSYEKYRKMEGFTEATPAQILEHQAEKSKLLQKMKEGPKVEEQKTEGVYFATVTQAYKTDGYGSSSARLIKTLRDQGLPVSTHYQNQKIAVLYHAPFSLVQLQSDYRILYTMFESDRLPDSWKPYLEAADLILVPSRWCADTFKRAGYEARVLPLGYDDETYHYFKRPNKRKNRDYFNFLHYNAFNIRKGFPEVFKAFVEEFSRDEPVRLILKTTQEMSQIPAPFRNLEAQYPNIRIITGKLPAHEMQEILEYSDCFVFPSRGEGFGMTPLEAMATGMPAIVPNAHGITEYFNADYMYEVKVASKCPALYSRYKDMDVGKMVVCDIQHLRQQMRYVYEHQEEAQKMGDRASEYVRQWTLSKTAANLKGIIEEVLSKPIPPRKLKNVLTLEKVT